MEFKKPSSTITAAGLAGLATAAVFATINEFSDIQISAGYVSLITTLISSWVGYRKKENVLPIQKPIEQVAK